MRHLFSTRLRVVLIVAILLAAGLTVLSNATGHTLPDMMVEGIMAPFRYGMQSLTNSAEQFYSYMFQYETLAAENEALKAQIAQMESDARQADAYQRENQRLRNLLDLSSTREDFKLVDGYIIAKSSTDWSSTITINKGTNAGIARDMCVVTANHEVVGLVTEAGPDYAVIKTILDSSLEISATIASSGYSGMVRGGYTDGRKDMMRMDYLPSSAIIRNNDQVVTSGSTVYPRDLIMGYVVDAGFGDTGVAKFAMLVPAVDFGRLEQVFVLTSYSATVVGGSTAAPENTTAPTSPIPQPTENQLPTGGVMVGVG
ncbi:MAG: rod shape-determining protein MreC [Oscillospiraceae bacterium]|nr:rod shape-determining protein MreC [Oscillospiraceae bacterium]